MNAKRHQQRWGHATRRRLVAGLWLSALLLVLAGAAVAQTPPAESLPSGPEATPGSPESAPSSPESAPDAASEAPSTPREAGSPPTEGPTASGGATLEETAIGFIAEVAARNFERADSFLLPEAICTASRDPATCLDYVAQSRARLRALGSRVPEGYRAERVVVIAREGPSNRLVEVLAPEATLGAGLRLHIAELGGRFYVVLGVEGGSTPGPEDADAARDPR